MDQLLHLHYGLGKDRRAALSEKVIFLFPNKWKIVKSLNSKTLRYFLKGNIVSGEKNEDEREEMYCGSNNPLTKVSPAFGTN